MEQIRENTIWNSILLNKNHLNLFIAGFIHGKTNWRNDWLLLTERLDETECYGIGILLFSGGKCGIIRFLTV